jgi:hypothetical protein
MTSLPAPDTLYVDDFKQVKVLSLQVTHFFVETVGINGVWSPEVLPLLVVFLLFILT